MAKLLKLRGGTTSEHGSFTGAVREVTVDTSKDTLVVHDGSTAGGFSMMRSDIMQESLDVNGQSIVSASNGNIAITPNGSGKVVLDGISYPTSDGSNGQVITTNGSGVLSFGTVDLSVKANIASPTFTGTPASTTASAGTNTTQIATTAFVKTAVDNAEPFPSGTSMLFQQTSAPTGWTKQTSHNDKSLRLVTGSVGTGGSVAFSTALGSGATVAGGSVSGNPTNNHAVSAGNLSVSKGNLAGGSGNLSVSVSGNISNTSLSVAQMPSHAHSNTAVNVGYWNFTSHPGAAGNTQGTLTSSSTGGGGSHNHGHNLSGNVNGSPSVNGNPSLSGSPSISGNVTAGNLSVGASTASINVQYVDFIIANKD